ncbi:hypothetical protein HOF56_01540 [Candidatus Peribacteria bacterium]|jgi:hypothetical protein|nr:hypothetical protein [Candidatus Peribacteria bacterium]MBT4020774.1 hypothetical protein [Candidatus Peribacteria bacterium]MBT4241054.1 hypothetical protein [Candidatus Peribacteria bacterium]MBT4474447.1 hypothetical protein [Candidatus Peribacteria bacterium]
MKLLIIKNILIHAALVPFYFFATKEVALMPNDKLDTLLLFVGLIVIAPITSNFVYKYKDAISGKAIIWGHITTLFSILVIGMLFVTLDVLLIYMIGNVLVFRLAIVLFWIAVVTFDFADFLTRNDSRHA